MKIRNKCKHDKIECKGKKNKFYCKACKEVVDINEWIKRYDLDKDLEFVKQYRFDPKIKDAFY